MQGFAAPYTPISTLARQPRTAQASSLVGPLRDHPGLASDGFAQMQKKQPQPEPEYVHIENVDYQNYKYKKGGEKSFITEIPPKKPPVHIFKNKKETIEKAIQSLHIKRLYIGEESPDESADGRMGKRSGSMHDFEKSLETAKHQAALEDYNLKRVEDHKRELEKESVEMMKNNPPPASQRSGRSRGQNKPGLNLMSNRPMTTEQFGGYSGPTSFDYFRKTFMKEFKIDADVKLKGKSSSLKNKILRQEFLHYSDVSQRYLADLCANLQDHKIEEYSYEEYKAIKSKFSNNFSWELLFMITM